MITTVKGTRDILPPDSYIWNRVEVLAAEVFQGFGYGEIRTPLMEPTELFTRSIGEDTDIVNKEMYTFLDKKGRSLTLRPEGTAPVARAYISNSMHTLPHPLRLYYVGPMFRYERPQKGRYRQFFQIGAELIGLEEPAADLEMLSLLVAFLSKLEFTDLSVGLNSVGCDACRPGYRDGLRAVLVAHKDELCADCVRRIDTNPLRVLDCKEEGCQHVKALLPPISGYLCGDCRTHLDFLLDGLKRLGVSFEINDRLVRGLDYYTRTVFEVVSGKLGAQNAICGGGRYNKLISDLGGPQVPGIGFAIGQDRLIEILPEAFKAKVKSGLDYYVIPISANELLPAFDIAAKLRARGFKVGVALEGKGPRKGLKFASTAGAEHAIILGEDEVRSGELVIKNLATGAQEKKKLSEL